MKELEIGKEYIVTCMVFKNDIVPIIPHLHSDKENGQEEPHYHLDDRFDCIIDGVSKEIDSPVRIFPGDYPDHVIEYLPMVAKKSIIETYTDVEMILDSDLKMDNLKHDRCPHRGFDLSKVLPDVTGVKRCPIHGLCVRGFELTLDHELLFKQKELSRISDKIDEHVDFMLENGIPVEQHFLYGRYKELKEEIEDIKRKIKENI